MEGIFIPVGTRRILDVYFASNSRLGNTRIRKHVYYTSFLRLQNTRIFLDVLYTSNIRVDKCRLILVCIRRLKCVYSKLNLDVAFISKCLSFVFIYSSKNIFARFICFYNAYFSGINILSHFCEKIAGKSFFLPKMFDLFNKELKKAPVILNHLTRSSGLCFSSLVS